MILKVYVSSALYALFCHIFYPCRICYIRRLGQSISPMEYSYHQTTQILFVFCFYVVFFFRVEALLHFFHYKIHVWRAQSSLVSYHLWTPTLFRCIHTPTGMRTSSYTLTSIRIHMKNTITGSTPLELMGFSQILLEASIISSSGQNLQSMVKMHRVYCTR